MIVKTGNPGSQQKHFKMEAMAEYYREAILRYFVCGYDQLAFMSESMQEKARNVQHLRSCWLSVFFGLSRFSNTLFFATSKSMAVTKHCKASLRLGALLFCYLHTKTLRASNVTSIEDRPQIHLIFETASLYFHWCFASSSNHQCVALDISPHSGRLICAQQLLTSP